MNIKLATVIRDITGKTGLSIVKAILDGERSPEQLSKLRDRRIKADQETIRKSLEGYWREEHLFTLQQAYDSYCFTKRQIKECDTKIENVLAENTSPLETNQDKSKKNARIKTNPNLIFTAI